MFKVKFFGPQVVSHNLEQVGAICEFCLKIDYLLLCNFQGSYESQPEYPKRISLSLSLFLSLSLSLAKLFCFLQDLGQNQNEYTLHTHILNVKKFAAFSVL